MRWGAGAGRAPGWDAALLPALLGRALLAAAGPKRLSRMESCLLAWPLRRCLQSHFSMKLPHVMQRHLLSRTRVPQCWQ